MIITMTTVREIPDDMLEDWVKLLHQNGMRWVSLKQLREYGVQVEHNEEEIRAGIYTKATTQISILKKD